MLSHNLANIGAGNGFVACTMPSYYLNQFWYVVKRTLSGQNKSKWKNSYT